MPCLLLTVLFLSPLLLNTDKTSGQNQPPFLVAAEEKTTRQNKAEQPVVSCFSPALSDSPIPSLAAVAAVAPPAPSNSSCSAPFLPSPPSCTDPAFTGQLLKQRRKIVHMILFAFEVGRMSPRVARPCPDRHPRDPAAGSGGPGGSLFPGGGHAHTQGRG